MSSKDSSVRNMYYPWNRLFKYYIFPPSCNIRMFFYTIRVNTVYYGIFKVFFHMDCTCVLVWDCHRWWFHCFSWEIQQPYHLLKTLVKTTNSVIRTHPRPSNTNPMAIRAYPMRTFIPPASVWTELLRRRKPSNGVLHWSVDRPAVHFSANRK